MSAGAIVWAAHFTAIYGITALACARGVPGTVPWVIGVATLFAVAAVLAIVIPAMRSADFSAWLTASVAGLALIAIVWEALPVFAVPACA